MEQEPGARRARPDATVDAYTKDIATNAKEVGEKSKLRITKAEGADSQMTLYQQLKPGCDYLLVNFDVRRVLRNMEADHLQTAKLILQGKVRIPSPPSLFQTE